jgi:hypothetical protein
MTSNPTLLGTGGHSFTDQSYDSTTYYSNVGLGRCALTVPGPTIESYASQIIRAAGTISYLSWGLHAGIGTALTLTLNKNSVGTALFVSIPSGHSGWFTDSTDDVTVVSQDKLDFATNVATRGAYSPDFYCVSARFDALTGSAGSAQMLATVGPGDFGPAQSPPNYMNFLGLLHDDVTSESQQQFYCLAAGTWQNMAAYLESNSLNGTATFNSRINGSNGTMALSIPDTSMSGYFEDTSDKDSVSAGDYLNYMFSVLETTNTGFAGISWIGAHFVATDPTQCMIGGAPSTAPPPGGKFPVIPEGKTVYSSLFGAGNVYSTVYRSTGLFPYALRASKFTNHLILPSSAAATFTLLQNDSGSSLTASALSGHTGYFISAATEMVDFAVGDTCANQIMVTGDPTTSVTWDGAALLLTASS